MEFLCLKEKLTAFTAYLAYRLQVGTYMYEIDVRSAVCDEDGWMGGWVDGWMMMMMRRMVDFRYPISESSREDEIALPRACDDGRYM